MEQSDVIARVEEVFGREKGQRMNTSPKKFRVTLRSAEDGSDSYVLPIPNAVMADLTWKDGDTLTIEIMPDDVVVISNRANDVELLDQEVVALAEEVFGDHQKAIDWLFREHWLLGMSPAAYLHRGNPKREVLKILQSIMYGGVV
jgi:antitoxin component of MazEF toxin-antitoxin module